MLKLKIVTYLVSVLFLVVACGSKTTQNENNTQGVYKKVSPEFNQDSAYRYIDNQVGFGYRVPNSPEHVACGDYLVAQLKHFGAEVVEQKAEVKAYDGTILNMRNIIGSYNVDQAERILLFAHWDTRPFADRDGNPENHRKPILGANDGASGIGVLLEIARQIQLKTPALGIDIIFFDAEDYGTPAFDDDTDNSQNWWCLGSQYWSKNPHTPNYKARYGILLDMVGAPGATFYKEQYSDVYATDVVRKIWGTAYSLGYGKYFINKKGGAIIDDHVPVIENRNIPCANIVQFDPNSSLGFGWYWHTVNDDMKNINRETLKAVGQTVMEIIYKEK